MNKKGIKIKRTKSLYAKRKSPARRVLELGLLIVVCAALVFVGYTAGTPVIQYLTGKFVPAVTEENTEPPVGGGESAPSDTETETPPEPAATEKITLMADNAMQSAQTLSDALLLVKSAGADAAVVTLKGADGKLCYRSSLAQLAGSEINAGTLTLPEIRKAFADAAVTPYAEMYALRDSVAPVLIQDASYTTTDGFTWFDDRADRGGKPWLNPKTQGGREYLSALAYEISAAGFENIYLRDLSFPEFRPYDLGILADARDLSDHDKRVSLLKEVYDDINAAARAANASVTVGVIAEIPQMSDGDMNLADRLPIFLPQSVLYITQLDNGYAISKNSAAALTSSNLPGTSSSLPDEPEPAASTKQPFSLQTTTAATEYTTAYRPAYTTTYYTTAYTEVVTEPEPAETTAETAAATTTATAVTTKKPRKTEKTEQTEVKTTKAAKTTAAKTETEPPELESDGEFELYDGE